MTQRLRYHLFTGKIQRAFPIVCVSKRQFDKVQEIVDPKGKLTHPEYIKGPSLLLKLRQWPSSVLLTYDRHFMRHTSVPHLRDVWKLLKEIGEDYKE